MNPIYKQYAQQQIIKSAALRHGTMDDGNTLIVCASVHRQLVLLLQFMLGCVKVTSVTIAAVNGTFAG